MSTPLGQRQNLQYREIAGNSSHTFTVDREHRIDRILFRPNGDPSGVGVRIQLEGELLFNGLAAKLGAVAIATDDVTAANAQQKSPFVLRFDRLVTLSREFPITIEITGSVTTAVSLMGP
jgi:hypothetical protein